MRIAIISSQISLLFVFSIAAHALEADLNIAVSIPDEAVESVDKEQSEIRLLKLVGERYVETSGPENEVEISKDGQVSLEWSSLSFQGVSDHWPDYLLFGAFNDKSGQPVAFLPMTPISGDETTSVDLKVMAYSRSQFIASDQFPLQPFKDEELMERDLFPTTLQIFTQLLKYGLLRDGREDTRNRLYGLLLFADESILMAKNSDSAGALVLLAGLSDCEACVTDVVELRKRYIAMLTKIILETPEDRVISDLGIGNLRSYAVTELKRAAAIDPSDKITDVIVASLREIFDSKDLKLSPLCVDISAAYVDILFEQVNNRKVRKFSNADGRVLASIMSDCGQNYAILIDDGVSRKDISAGVTALCKDYEGQRLIQSLDKLNYMGLRARSDPEDTVHKFVNERKINKSCDPSSIGGT